ncbi:glycoside hydrolase family protein [Mycobacteroides abscessus subsp. abscessus]|nr:glycoside hydrolase family protein [Mycobacteroides abscessus subsp. abscessus]
MRGMPIFSKRASETVVMTGRTVRVLALDQARGVWGAQRYLLRLAPLLRDFDIEVVLGGPRSLKLHDDWRDAGFSAVHIDLPIERNIRNDGQPRVADIAREVRKSLTAARAIASAARANRCDAIWANAHWTHVEASIAGKLTRKPVVLHLHEEALPGLGQHLRAVAVTLSDRTVAVSDGVARAMPLRFQRRIQVIPNGVDTQEFSPMSVSDRDHAQALRNRLGVSASETMVLAATRIDPVKRIEDLIAAVEKVRHRDIHLVIAGETSGYPEYERQMREAADAVSMSRVSFCGHRTDLADLFRAADIVLHAGVVEGMPLGLLEAQSCGTPVVAYQVAGVPEAVVDGETGLLAPPEDVSALAIALDKLAASSQRRAEMGLAARAHIMTHHKIEDQAARNAKVVNEICGLSMTFEA